MKKIKIITATILATLLLTFSANAQNIWKGGTIGMETDWNTASNWSKNRVPDWSENVIIPDVSTQSRYFPEIDEEIIPIPHLIIDSNATLTVLSKGKLLIDGLTTIDSGIHLVGTLDAKGEIMIKNTILEDIDNQGGELFMHKKYFAKN